MEDSHILHNAMSFRYMDSIQHSKKKYGAMLEPLCRQYGLTRNELDILLFLANNPGFDRAADIVSMRQIAKSHVSLSVGSLENRGFLIRRFEETDRRVAHLVLTEAAAPIVREGQAAQQRFFRQIFAGLSREELMHWGNILQKVITNIEAITD